MTVIRFDVKIEIYRGLDCEETICTHCRQHVHQEIMEAPVPTAHQLSNIFEHVVKGFYDTSFSKLHLIIKWHEFLFHVGSQASYDMYSVIEKFAEKAL